MPIRTVLLRPKFLELLGDVLNLGISLERTSFLLWLRRNIRFFLVLCLLDLVLLDLQAVLGLGLDLPGKFDWASNALRKDLLGGLVDFDDRNEVAFEDVRKTVFLFNGGEA